MKADDPAASESHVFWFQNADVCDCQQRVGSGTSTTIVEASLRTTSSVYVEGDRFTMPRILLIAFGLTALFASLSFSQDVASARSARLAERFNFFCLQSVPDFLEMSARSSKMGLQVIEDRAMPMPNGEKFYQKNWLVEDASGQFALLSEDVKGPEHAIGCGIAAHDADGTELTRFLSMDPRLRQPREQILDDPKVGKVIWWDVQFATETA